VNVTGKAAARNHRICYRTTRASYWFLRELAQNAEISVSTLIYYMVEHVSAEVLANDTSTVLQTISSHMNEEELAAFERAVEKVVDRDPEDDLPW